jgi:hypothetical protein
MRPNILFWRDGLVERVSLLLCVTLGMTDERSRQQKHKQQAQPGVVFA